MSLRMLTVSMAFLAISPAVHAQDAAPSAAKPSVEGYLCTFAGKCGGVHGAAPVATRDAPETKGFRLARPTGEVRSATSASMPTPVRDSHVGSARPTWRSPARSRQAPSSQTMAAAYASVSSNGGAAVPSVGARRPRADLMIGFELNSARLSAEGTRAAQVFAQSLLMPELKEKRFLIEGHTDLIGGARINGPLSAARARTVADYLASLGVDRSRLDTRGYGASAPLPGHGASDPANRRVEAELIS